MKKIYFGSNLKMYKTAADTVAYVKELFRLTEKLDRSQIGLFIIPSYTALMAVSDAVPHESIMIGAQNMYWEEKGQFTGEISPVMLEELKVNLVMIGHSERRHIFGETDFLTNQKVKAALRHGFTALLCVGETGEEKEYGISEEVLRRQLKIGFHGVGRCRKNHSSLRTGMVHWGKRNSGIFRICRIHAQDHPSDTRKYFWRKRNCHSGFIWGVCKPE